MAAAMRSLDVHLLAQPVDWAAPALILGAVVLAGFLATRYRRCPDGKLLVVFDSRSFIVRRTGRFVWPIVQDSAYLDLASFAVEAEPAGVPAELTVAIGTAPELMENAAIHLIRQSRAEITGRIRDLLDGTEWHDAGDTGPATTRLNAARPALEAQLATIGLELREARIKSAAST